MGNQHPPHENLKFATAVYNLSKERGYDAARIAEKINTCQFMPPVTANDVEEMWATYDNRRKFLRFFGKRQKGKSTPDGHAL